MTSKQHLLQSLAVTFIQLKPSPVHGIGVFAVCDIPKGFRNIFSPPHNEFTNLSFEEVDQLPVHTQQLIENYCLFDKNHFFVPNTGFKILDLALFLNHSDQPNLCSINDGDYFETIRDIKAGEELFLDYGEIV
jgi:SET domain-containing protein